MANTFVNEIIKRPTGQQNWVVEANDIKDLLNYLATHITVNGQAVSISNNKINIVIENGQVQTYTIIWNKNGATSANIPDSSVTSGSQIILPDNPSRSYSITWDSTDGSTVTGGTTTVTYPFKGWFDAASGGNAITNETIVTDNMTCYAQWNTKTPSKISLPTDPTKDNYNFIGWNSKENGSGNTITSSTSTPSTTTTYYAQWSPIETPNNIYYGVTTTEINSSNYDSFDGVNNVSSIDEIPNVLLNVTTLGKYYILLPEQYEPEVNASGDYVVITKKSSSIIGHNVYFTDWIGEGVVISKVDIGTSQSEIDNE